MKYDFIGIKNQGVYGVKNPVLMVDATIELNDYDIEIYVDGKQINVFNIVKTSKDLSIRCNINNKWKNVVLNIIHKNKTYEVVNINNTKIGYIKRFLTGAFTNNKKLKMYPFIGVKESGIFGVNNPVLILTSTIELENYEFLVHADDEEIKDYEVMMFDDNKTSTLKVILPKNTHNIKLDLVYNDNNYNILDINTNKLSRMLSKIKRMLKTILSKIKLFFHVVKKAIKFFWREYHFLVPPSMYKKYFKDFLDRMKGSTDIFYNPFDIVEYNKWLDENKTDTVYERLDYKPLISILIPVYNIRREYLSECIDSILNQSYENFEVCLVDDASTNEDVRETLEYYKALDKRIRVKYRTKNGHISACTNDALKMAKGEFIALMDDDDTLSIDALYENVLVLNKNKQIDFIYSDEDKINLSGRYCDPHFKPDFSPDTLMSLNYICHFSVIRKSIVEDVGGFEVGLEGAQDHDLFLKVSELTNNIYHIPKILYHWRMSEGSTSSSIKNKDYATDKGKIAIEHALERRGLKGWVEKDSKSTYYIVHYELVHEPLVSIIIPTRDYADITRTCLESIYEKTTYKNFEIILANNNSEKEETFELFDEMKSKHKNFKVVDINIEFNYSKINNIAVSKCKGEYIVLLNNDTEVISPEWLTEMIGYASLSHAGTVGAKLLYPDGTIQHAGTILGLGGVASHAYIGKAHDALGLAGRLSVPYNYAANTAACLAIKKSKFLEVGGLEEDLKVAYNDVDFNIKILEKGYYNITLENIELIHYESKSRGLDTTSEKYKRFLIESEYMWNKWNNILNNDPYYNPNFAKKYWFVLPKK